MDDGPVVVNAISDLSANEDDGQRDDQLGERIQRRGRRQRFHHEDALESNNNPRSRDRDDHGERPDPRLPSRPERHRDGNRNGPVQRKNSGPTSLW